MGLAEVSAPGHTTSVFGGLDTGRRGLHADPDAAMKVVTEEPDAHFVQTRLADGAQLTKVLESMG